MANSGIKGLNITPISRAGAGNVAMEHERAPSNNSDLFLSHVELPERAAPVGEQQDNGQSNVAPPAPKEEIPKIINIPSDANLQALLD